MALPRLIHPVPVSIQQLDRSATYYDDDMDEPIQQAARASTVVVDGQLKWSLDEKQQTQIGGTSERSDGYVLFRLVDLTAASITIKREDRFTRLGTVDVDVYVTALRYEGHYPDQGGPSLVKAFFADRQPQRQTRGV